MANMLLFFVLIVAVRGAHKHNPKFPKVSEEYEPRLNKVACTSDHERIRNNIIEESKCGEPKDVFISLNPPSKSEQVSPGAVWVKRCVGLCDYDAGSGSQCVAKETVIRRIPVRIHNVKTRKDTCATYPVVEHVRCGCCSGSAEDCAPPRVYNPQEPEYEVESI